MMYGNEIVWSDAKKDWYEDVNAVIIEAEKKLSFRVIAVEEKPLIGAPFSAHPSILIVSTQVPTIHSSSINRGQARVLTSFVSFLDTSGECATVTQKVRGPSSGLSDSDDEQVPSPEILPVFTDCELHTVQTSYKKLWDAFSSAVMRRFTNAAGKMFFHALAEFILILRTDGRYAPYLSTNPHGDCQPGSTRLTHTIPKPNTRQVSSTTTSSSSTE